MRNRIYLLFFLTLSFLKGYSTGITTVYPPNNFVNPVFKVDFSWNPILNVTSYRLKIAADPAFASIVKDTVVNASSATILFNTSTSTVYWKIQSADPSIYAISDINRLDFMNPSQDPNLLLWLSADSNVILQPDSTVSSWTNIIPNGIVAVQPTSTSRPRLVNHITELNNKLAIRFDGTDDFLKTSTGGVVGSIFMLHNWRGASVFPQPNGLLTNTLGNVTDDVFFESAGSGGTQLYAGYFKDSTRVNNLLTYSLAPLNKYKVVTGKRRVGAPLLSHPGFFIGGDGFGGGFFSRSWNGDITEMVVSKTASTTESDSINIYLMNKYAPPVSLGKDIVIGTSFSDSILLDAGARFTSFLWSTGAITQTIKVATAGTYSVKVKDVFDRESTDEVLVYPYRRFNNLSVYLCAGDSLILNLGISNPQFSFLWSTGATTNKITVKTSGQYTVTIRDSKGQDVLDMINVVIASPVLSPAVPPSDTIKLCVNEKLFVTSEAPVDSIHWSTGSSAPFVTFGTQGIFNINVYARTVNGCILSKAFKVKVNGFAPTANFGALPACQNSSTLFTDSSTAPIGDNISNWKWTFGDGNIASNQNPSNMYLSPGTYTASLKITTNVGCTDSIAKIVTVNKKPAPAFFNLLSCEGLPTTFVDNTIPNAASIVDWNWNFGGLGVSNGIKNPSFNFPSAGTYNVQLVATNSNGCKDSITLPTIVNPSPVANFSFDSVCGLSDVHFKWLSTVIPPATIQVFTWDFGDGTFEASQKEPPHHFPAPGTYDVKLTVNSTDQCSNTVQKQVKVFDFPVVDFDVSQTQCTGKEIQFTDISATPDGTPITKWNWFFSGQATSTEQNPRYTFNAEGNYTIQLTVKNAVGCSGTKLRSIAVSAPPTPKFTFSPQNGLPPLLVNYFNQSPITGNYFWDYGDNSPQVQAYNPPSHVYSTIGTYPIKLIATDFRGCTDTLVKYILVDKAFLDGVMATISITPDGDFYKVQVTIINNSNIEIRALGLSLQLGGGSVIRENWTGSLLPGKTVAYTFTGEIKLSDIQVPVICATIDNVNDHSPEDRTDNNSTCKEVRVGQFEVLNIYPNPAFENINFGIMLPQEGKVTIGFVDMLGQVMYKTEFDGVKGYNKLTMSTDVLNSAVYVAVVQFNGEIIREKFMRKGR